VKELKKLELKALIPEHIDYLPQDTVGGGSFGQCFHARYRGIDVVVKKMIHNNSAEDKLRAKIKLIHEAEVITSLGDHEVLPLFFGVITAKEPLCLLSIFTEYMSKASLFNKQQNNVSMITPLECLKTFAKICLALQHVHSRVFLHNDVMSNNVNLECRRDSEKYNAILINFSKSTKASTILPSVSSRKRAHHPTKLFGPRSFETTAIQYSERYILCGTNDQVCIKSHLILRQSSCSDKKCTRRRTLS